MQGLFLHIGRKIKDLPAYFIGFIFNSDVNPLGLERTIWADCSVMGLKAIFNIIGSLQFLILE